MKAHSLDSPEILVKQLKNEFEPLNKIGFKV